MDNPRIVTPYPEDKEQFAARLDTSWMLCRWEPDSEFSVLTQFDKSYYLAQESAFRNKYHLMYAVASVIQPKKLIELGTHAGSSMDAYVSASNCEYVGYDIFTHEKHESATEDWKPKEIAEKLIAKRGFTNIRLVEADLRTLNALEFADMVVVDAAHDFTNAYEDMKLALSADPTWIYIDDMKGAPVAEAWAKIEQEFATRIEWTAWVEHINGSLVVKLRRPTLREGTFDREIWKSVVHLNEYELPAQFDSGDAIVDLGSHIGSFARACIDRGARRVICFEPDIGNLCLLCANLRDEIRQGWVEPFALAVGAEGLTFQEHTGYTELGDTINTGGGYLVSCDKKYSSSEMASGQRMTVPVIGVNYLMALVENIRLLKMDVEGSEFSILNSFNFYGSVQEIVGEYHCQPDRDHNWIHDKLKPLGFNVRSERGIMGRFWAKRE